LYKVVFTVIEVNEPESIDGEPPHVTGPWDYMDQIKYFSCPDSERPVVFKVERVPVEQGEVPLR
jgi:uncharacterized repeat protein (TIGR04076 family)